MIDAATLEKWTLLARRDDCFTAADSFVPSDIRRMLVEIERLRNIENKLLKVFADGGVTRK